MNPVTYSPGMNLSTLKPGQVLQNGNSSFLVNSNGTYTQQGSQQGGAMSLAQLQTSLGINAPSGGSSSNPLSSIIPSTSPSVTTGTNPLSIVGPVAAAGSPTPPSMESILSESGLTSAQSNLETLMDQYTSLQAEMSNADLEIGGNNQGVASGIVSGQTSAVASRNQMQMNDLSAMIQAANTHVSNLQNLVQLSMSAAGTDYQNAVTATDDAFSKAMSMQTALNTQSNINQQNAAAYLSSLSGLITSGSLNPQSLPASMKASIATAELQAGWPVGTIENFTSMKPGANIVGSSNSVNGNGQAVTTLIYQNPDGSLSQTNITMPGSPVTLFGVLPGTSSGGTGTQGTGPGGSNGYNASNPAFANIDSTQPLSSVLQDPTQLAALFGAMNQAEGGGVQVGSQFNNPLDLTYNQNMASLGATDSGEKTSAGQPIASFPDQETAEAAYQAVMSSPTYANMTVGQMLQTWSGYTGQTTTPSSSNSSNPAIQSYVTGLQNGTIASLSGVPAGMRTAVAEAMANTPSASYTPTAARKFALTSTAIVSNFIQLPAYQLVAGGQLYLGRIAAAMQTPGSISDQDLLDSLTKLNTGGNAISDAQVSLITDGQSFSDWASVLSNKLGTGGVLSDAQRSQIQTLATNIYQSYLKSYTPIYQQATSQLTAAGVPQAFWTIPNLNDLSGTASAAGVTGGNSIQEQASAAGYDYSAMSAAGYSDVEIEAAINASSTDQ